MNVIRSVVSGFLACLVAAAYSNAALADDGEPVGVPMGQMMCLYGYNDYRPCDSGPAFGQASNAAIPEMPPDPMEQYVPRYNTALDQLQRLTGGLTDFDSMPPQTEDELSSRLSTLFVAGAYRLDSVNALRRHNANAAARANRISSEISAEIAKMEASLATAAARKKSFVDKYEAWAASGGPAEHRHLNAMEAAFDAHRDLLTTRADRTIERIVQWLWVAGMPAAERSPRHVDHTGPQFERAMADLEDDVGLGAASRPQVAFVEQNVVAFRAPPGGTVDQKLDAVESLGTKIEAATVALEREQPDAVAAEARAAALDIRLHALKVLSGRAEAEVGAAKFRAENAPANLDASRRRTAASARNLLLEAVEIEVLSRLEKLTKSHVKELLRINGNAVELAALTDEKVANLYRASRIALNIKPGVSIKGMKEFLAVQRKILDDLKNPLQSAIVAANVLGNADQNGAAEAVAIFRGLRRDCLSYAETAGKALPASVRKIALRMLDDVD